MISRSAKTDRESIPGIADGDRRSLLASAYQRISREFIDNIGPTKSVESLWLVSRIVIAVVSIVTAYLFWGTTGSTLVIMGAATLALASNTALVFMLRRGNVIAVAATGFLMDNFALLVGWTGSLWLIEQARHTNDMYIAVFPILTLWSARLGLKLGIPYALFWMGWIIWTFFAFLPSYSYEIEQLPLRVTFLLLTALLGMWMARVLKLQRRIAEESSTRADRLQELDYAKDQFIATVSHELKTPMAAIIGFTRLLRNETEGTKREERLDVIERNSQRLNVLIDDLLDMSRIKRGTLRLDVTAVAVHELVQTSVDALAAQVSERSQSVEINLDHDPCWIEVDETRIAQVIGNLISNASKYSPQDSTIRVSSHVDGGRLIVSVSDEGDGISEEDQLQLFEPFYRTQSAENSATPGTGLGLYISWRIAELHGGHLRIVSSPGTGTTAELSLPGVSFAFRKEVSDVPRFSNTFDYLEEVG